MSRAKHVKQLLRKQVRCDCGTTPSKQSRRDETIQVATDLHTRMDRQGLRVLRFGHRPRVGKMTEGGNPYCSGSVSNPHRIRSGNAADNDRRAPPRSS